MQMPLTCIRCLWRREKIRLKRLYLICRIGCLVLKVRDLVEASNMYGTLNNVLDVDVKNDTVRTQGSLSCNLRRVRQGLDLIRAIFENFLSSDALFLFCICLLFPSQAKGKDTDNILMNKNTHAKHAKKLHIQEAFGLTRLKDQL
ncbi:uncharacterized protein LOC114295013 isoform X5 [Camellia sinensis]|uniref:uncharacterized protein LOC114295013 isoform X5 n=1 Tax=Camellia sinensis TaxID=4442 RepID=UPI001035EF33|nr:uncharacterized protein LOC114295013 isoform X5 [Camellia sinensis]